MRETLRRTLAEAVEQLDADASSDTWFELSEVVPFAVEVRGGGPDVMVTR
jgi:hypothetical protein